MTSRIIDFHCDTILRVADEGVDLAAGGQGGHVDLERLRRGGVGCQVFACFASRMEHGDRVSKRLDSLLDVAGSLRGVPSFVFPDSPEDLAALRHDDQRVGVLLAVEGGDGLEGRVERLEAWKLRGVRYLTLAWGDNELTGSAFGDGSGLTPVGEDAVRVMDELGMLVDISHMSDAAIEDTLRTASGVVIASHSNCRAVCASPRNLTDDQIRAIADRGGVVGVMFAPGFLSEAVRRAEEPGMLRALERARKDPTSLLGAMADARPDMSGVEQPDSGTIVDHLEHLVEVGGVGCAAFGSDFDGIPATPTDVTDCGSFPVVLQAMRQRGFADRDIEQICWGNWARVLVGRF